MSTRTQQRTLNTLQTIKLQHQHEGKLPSLAAVSTIYANLLQQNAGDTAWQLFHEVASLPLLTTRLEVKCIAEGEACEMRCKKGWCNHQQIMVSCTVQLESSDQYLFDKGRRINGPQVMSWWGRQLAVALGARSVG